MKRVIIGAAAVIGAVLSGAAPASASTGWQIQNVGPKDNASGLLGVSCPAKGNCTAVGWYIRNQVGHSLAEHWDGSRWAIQPIPNPGEAAGDYALLSGVSCASPTSCTAVGSFAPVTGGEVPLAEHWDGSRWAIRSVPLPAGTSEGALNAVSCAAAGNCAAVGWSYSLATRRDAPLAEHWNGTAWIVQHVPFVKDAIGGLDGVSCHSAADCVAVGDYGIFNQGTNLFAEHWNGSRWAIQTLPTPAGTSFALGAVSCPSATACTAAGGSFNGTQQQASIIERWNGTNWALQADAAPAHTKLFGVSCPSAAACTAVGEVWAGQPGTYSKVVAESWDGTGWAVQTVPVPHGTIGAALYAAWCLGTACLHRRRGCQPRRPTGRA